MKYKVGVEDNLSSFREALYNNGYDVLNLSRDPELSEVTMRDLDAIVVSGQNDNLLGVQTIKSPAPVINAEGRTPEDVLSELKARLERKGE